MAEPEQPRQGVLMWGLLAAALGTGAGLLLEYPDGRPALTGAFAVGLTTLVAWCWLTRCLPLAAASLLPLALFPVFGVLDSRTAAQAYASPIIWLFFGGFVLALGIERWGLHRRLALHIIVRVGLRPRRLVLGFMLAGLFLSMWISNTATSLMLLPIGVALLQRLDKEEGLPALARERLSTCLLLGIAYGCSVGGIATPIGTGPNLIFLDQYEQRVDPAAGADSLSFLQWMLMVAPVSIAFGLLIWAGLVFFLHRLPAGDRTSGSLIREELLALGPMSPAERRMLYLFVATVLLWVTRKDLDLGSVTIYGWAHFLGFVGGQRNFVEDGSVAVLAAVAAFLIPARPGAREALMDWPTARRLPWDILLLLGGGIAIAKALDVSGVCAGLALALEPVVRSVPAPVAVLVTVFLVTFLTEVTSNTATTSIMLPVLAATGVAAEMDPRMLMLPATLAASCAFMLPIATPPNAVVFSSGRLSFAQMARTGFLLNLATVVLLSLYTWFVLRPVLGMEADVIPSWWRR